MSHLADLIAAVRAEIRTANSDPSGIGLVCLEVETLQALCDQAEGTAGEWQVVACYLERIRVPGGWIYRSNRPGQAPALAFVPMALDPCR